MSRLVSIVIVNWNGLKYIDDCIKSLLAQTYTNMEIIIVDNASADGSVEHIEHHYPMVKIVRNDKNLGFAEGTNRGVAVSGGELVALFNQDAIAEAHWLERLVTVISSSADIAAVSGKVYYWGDRFGKDAVFCTWPKIDPYTAFPSNFNGNEPMGEVDYLSGCAMLVKREAMDRVGLLDTGYFLYFEETDWCARMIRAGYRLIYIPDAIVWHVVSGSIDNIDFKLMYMSRNRIRFALKNFDLSYIPVFVVAFSVDTLFELARGIQHKDLNAFNIRLRAIYWNVCNVGQTIKSRRNDLSRIRNARSYNRSLPLRHKKRNA